MRETAVFARFPENDDVKGIKESSPSPNPGRGCSDRSRSRKLNHAAAIHRAGSRKTEELPAQVVALCTRYTGKSTVEGTTSPQERRFRASTA